MTSRNYLDEDENSVCEHVKAVRVVLDGLDMDIWSEHGEEPSGWVNVHCELCSVTYEVLMRGAYDEELEELEEDEEEDDTEE